jgi:hypothetical protein
MRVPLFTWRYHLCILFRNIVSINFWNLIKIVKVVLDKLAILRFETNLKEPYFWNWNVYIRRTSTYDKLINTECEQNPSNVSVAIQAHIQTNRSIVRQVAFQKSLGSCKQLTYSTELSCCREVANCAAIQEFPNILWNQKFHFRVHKSPLPLPIQSQINPVHTIPSYLSKLHFNDIAPLTSRSSLWPLSFWLSHQNPTCIPFLPNACHMPYLSHAPWLDHSNYTWRRVQVMKLLIMQISENIQILQNLKIMFFLTTSVKVKWLFQLYVIYIISVPDF